MLVQPRGPLLRRGQRGLSCHMSSVRLRAVASEGVLAVPGTQPGAWQIVAGPSQVMVGLSDHVGQGRMASWAKAKARGPNPPQFMSLPFQLPTA